MIFHRRSYIPCSSSADAPHEIPGTLKTLPGTPRFPVTVTAKRLYTSHFANVCFLRDSPEFVILGCRQMVAQAFQPVHTQALVGRASVPAIFAGSSQLPRPWTLGYGLMNSEP
jgi:hypothetical protein